jgi:pimeloyl-ACP methyl ester carboxylesterase
MAQTVSRVQVGVHQLEATVFGSGGPAVVIEPAFGGSAASWRAIAESLAQDTMVVTYDRAPYGSSSRARDGRTASEIARDLHGVLDALAITRPVVLVGHSAGGQYVRAFAGLYPDQVAGMVLIDSSPEAQERLRGNVPWRIALSEALIVPLLRVVPRKMLEGADRRSLIREFRATKRMSAADRPLDAGALGDRPLIVVTRAPGSERPIHRGWQVWHDLHHELAQLSNNQRHIIADHPGHRLHQGDPALITATVGEVLHSVRTQTPLMATPAKATDS